MSSVYLKHYNPNHDKLGRFARSSSGPKDFTIKKGTKTQRVTKVINETNEGRTFVTYTKVDNNIYRALGERSFGARVADTLVTKNDVKVAGRQAMAEAFIEIYKDVKLKDLVKHTSGLPNIEFGKDLKGNFDKYLDIKSDRKYNKAIEKMYKNADKSQDSFDTAYTAFSTNLHRKDKVSDKFMKKLSEKGYGALIDDYDSWDPKHPGVYDYGLGNGVDLRAKRALIFIDRKKDLELTDRIWLEDHQTDAIKWLRKNGYWHEVKS